ncbi:MAG: zf-HC2 domain-containing protein [Blastocatellia bacterium]
MNREKTPNCNMHEALVAYLYDEATPEESKRFEAHLSDCSDCKSEIQAFERVRGVLQQWQLDDLPVVRVVADAPPGSRSMLAVVKELFMVTPLWAKALGAVAAAVFVLAVLGTDVSVGRGGFSFHADLLRRNRNTQPEAASTAQSASLNDSNSEQIRNEVRTLVNKLIADNEREQKETIKAQLVSLETQLQTMHSADLAKLATRIQEQRARLKTIERDIDRREGLDLTDILFSEAGRPAQRSRTDGSD